jgi:type VI secretion system protein ImpA
MSAAWDSDQLLRPITEAEPCGESLEDKRDLSALEGRRLFGQAKPLSAPPEPTTDGRQGEDKWISRPPESEEWVQIRDEALAALAKSKDLRVLAHLGVALLRSEGVAAFADTLHVASQWLEVDWIQTYPRVDEDAIVRRSALNCFADPMAVVDALRRAPLVSSRQHGRFSLRDIEIAAHQLQPGPGDAQVDKNQIHAAFGSMPLDELTELRDRVVRGVAALGKIETTMRNAAGSDAVPSFDLLEAQLTKMSQALRAELAEHPGAATAGDAGVEVGDAGTAGEGPSLGGVVKSRQDAIRALDAVGDFFRRTEPSSPVPLFTARAKRLVSKDFLEVLADVAPDAVAQARAAGGLKEGES